MQQFTKEIANGIAYTSTNYRGTRYSLRRGQWGWELSTKRLSLGSMNFGGFKRFETLADVKAKCKAFASIELLDAI